MCPLLISQILNPGVNILCYFLNALSVLGIFNSEWTHSEHIGGGDAKGNEFFAAEKSSFFIEDLKKKIHVLLAIKIWAMCLY